MTIGKFGFSEAEIKFSKFYTSTLNRDCWSGNHEIYGGTLNIYTEDSKLLGKVGWGILFMKSNTIFISHWAY